MLFLFFYYFYFNNTTGLSETALKLELTVLNFKCTVIVPCQMNRNGKRRQNISVSPCKCSLHSSVCRLEQPACCGWRGHAVEREPSPNRSQSSHSVCYACRQPRFLMRLTQLPLHSFVSLPHLPVWEEEEEESSGTPSDSPPFRSSASLWSIWSHLLRADLFAQCISESYWVAISTSHRSHFDD